MKKKVALYFVSVLVLAGVFVIAQQTGLWSKLAPQKALANPGMCTVGDDLTVTGRLDIGNKSTCTKVSVEEGDLTENPNTSDRQAKAYCPNDTILTGGSCECQEKTNGEVIVFANTEYTDGTGSYWYCSCERVDGSGNIYVRSSAICCF